MLCLHLKRILMISMVLFWMGCAPKIVYRPAPEPQMSPPTGSLPQPPVTQTIPPSEIEVPPDVTPPEPKKPRELASLQLIDQAKALLDQNRPDDAIRLLERAINLHPQNGETYFYLAEAWLKKGNIPQAREFHSLAGIYLKKDRQWSSRMASQKIRIDNF